MHAYIHTHTYIRTQEARDDLNITVKLLEDQMAAMEREKDTIPNLESEVEKYQYEYKRAEERAAKAESERVIVSLYALFCACTGIY